MVAGTAPLIDDVNKVARRRAHTRLDQVIDSVLSNPSFYGEATLSLSIQGGRITLIRKDISETEKM